jgi:hypothetical protein
MRDSIIRAVANAASALGLLVLIGCNALPPLNFSPEYSGPSAHKLDADLKGVTVTLANPQDKTGQMPADGALAPPIWKEALQDAIDKSALFDDDSHRRVNIAVKVLKIDIPAVGLTFQTDVDARYQIVDRQSGAPLYDQVISSVGSVPLDWAFAGVIRRRESINRAVQNNIAMFMNSLYTTSLP